MLLELTTGLETEIEIIEGLLSVLAEAELKEIAGLSAVVVWLLLVDVLGAAVL